MSTMFGPLFGWVQTKISGGVDAGTQRAQSKVDEGLRRVQSAVGLNSAGTLTSAGLIDRARSKLASTTASAARNASDRVITAQLSSKLGKDVEPLLAGAGGATSFLGGITNGAKQVQDFFKQYGWVILEGVIGVLVIGFCGYYLYKYYTTVTPAQQKVKVEDIANTLNASTAKTTVTTKSEGFQSGGSVTSEQYNMLNMQPLAIKQVGYIGPVSDGVFDIETGTSQALRAGFRSFVFQIDYLDKESDAPVLVYRDDGMTLISKNTGDIGKVAETISNVAFRPEVPKYMEPIIIYLHFLRTPKDDPATDTSAYIFFLSKVAKALAPLAPQHLNMTPMGTFRRQMQESTLLTVPFNSFNNGQVIVLCNADTTSFRNNKPTINPAEDLDYWVNMRVYMNTDVDAVGTLGVTVPPPKGITPSAIVVSLQNLLKLTSKQLDAFIAETKHQFVIALPSQMNNPTTDDMTAALDKLGLNMIPLDIFSHDIEEVKTLVGQYNNLTYRPKPVGLRIATS